MNQGCSIMAGRADDNDVVLPGDWVSRRHVRFSDTDEGLRISDLGSRNGTLLNGRTLGSVARLVRAGDVVQVGAFTIKIAASGAQARAVPDGFLTLHSGAVAKNPFLRRRSAGQPEGNGDAEVVTEPGVELIHQLYALTERLASSPPLEDFLRDAVECARRVTAFDEGVLLLRGEDDRLSAFVTTAGEAAPKWSTTICTEALRRHSSMFVRHLPSDPRFNMCDSVVLAGALHVLCIPLFCGGSAVGVLYLSSRSVSPPSDSLIEFVTAIGHIAATAVVGARANATPAGEEGRALQAVLQGIVDHARFAHAATTEVAAMLTRYREAAGRAGVPSDVLRQIEEESGVVELLREAEQALSSVCEGATRTVQRLSPPSIPESMPH